MLLKHLTLLLISDLLNGDNPYFEQMSGWVYPIELQLSKANSFDTETPFLNLDLSISNDIDYSKIYEKKDDFDFEIFHFPFLDENVPRSLSLIVRMLIVLSEYVLIISDFNNRNRFLTAKFLVLQSS